jgi:nitrite reductase/ring-hydroxylating ferredoxin subunit
MNWTKALRLDELNETPRKVIHLEGAKILVLKHQEKIHAIAHACPHFKLPLTKGQISDDCAIICPFHKSAFDLETGDVKEWSPWPPVVGKVLGKLSSKKTLKVYPTKIEGDELFIQL